MLLGSWCVLVQIYEAISNNYYTNVARNIFRNSSQYNRSKQNRYPNQCNSMYLTPVTEKELIGIIKSLKFKSSCGIDEISDNLIKKCYTHLIKPLCHIINLSFSTGEFPEKLKIAKVKPLYKKGTESNVGNYRPVALLSGFSKIIEKVMLIRLTSFLTNHGIITNKQHGFRKDKSINTAIADFVKRVYESMDKKEENIGLFLDLSKYASLLRPPVTEGDVPGVELMDKMEWKQVFDILWSDPQIGDGCVPNTLRGAGTYFGPDVTEKFLERNKMLYLIRSHECKPGGYELAHEGKVITIFSASNYYEVGSNKGAYMKLVGDELTPHFVQFTTATARTKKLTFRQRIGLVESSAMRELNAQILTHRESLLQEFRIHDKEHSGLITVSEWCSSMETLTKLSIPWRLLRDNLVSTDPVSGKIEYQTTFQEPTGDRRLSDTTVVEVLYRNKSSLEAIFRIIDKDNSGYISMEEFSDAAALLEQHLQNPIPPDQLVDICRSMDINKDGKVDLNEFLETFRLVDMDRERLENEDQDDSSPDEEAPANYY